ncbi:MAG: POTRA domain-containing protein, partial [Candidatus Binatia bacterium]
MSRRARRATPVAVGRVATAALSLLGFVAGATDIRPETIGRPIRAVRFDGSASVDEADLRTQLPTVRGDPLSAEAVRDALEWLRAKEIFSSVNAEIVDADGGVDVRFVLEPADVVVGIDIRGAQHIGEAEIRRRARVREDEPLSEAKIASAVERLERLYVDRGYPDARVDIRPRREGAGRVVAQIRIREGSPITVEEVRIAGAPEDLPVSTLEKAVGVVKGDPWAADRPRRGRE